MNMKRLLTLVAFFATLQASAQQVNPVPDYVFANRMSAGRNTVTDTAAYFSIGPRYGATRGMMPPMVVDTASFSANKRNGLLIFSVQKNKFLYWDSVGVKWAEMAGTGGTAISSGDTAAMLLPYLRKADTSAVLYPYVRHAGYGLSKSTQSFIVDTAAIATRLRVQKGIDSVNSIIITGNGTANYLAQFTGTKVIGSSTIWDDGTNIGINNTSPTAKLDINGTFRMTGSVATYNNDNFYMVFSRSGTVYGYLGTGSNTAGGAVTDLGIRAENNLILASGGSRKATITSGGNLLINTTTDPGEKIYVNGSIRIANGGRVRGDVYTGTSMVIDNDLTLSANASLIFSSGGERMRVTSSGNVGINTQTPNASALLDVSSTTQGFLPPRMTTTQRDAISSPAAGLVIYNTTTSKLQVYTTSWTDLH